MNKVDVMSTPYSLAPARSCPPGRVVHAPYRREPYIRTRFPGGEIMDGKALAWTREYVLFHAEPDGVVTDEWVPASAVKRIRREESNWIDPYDMLR